MRLIANCCWNILLILRLSRDRNHKKNKLVLNTDTVCQFNFDHFKTVVESKLKKWFINEKKLLKSIPRLNKLFYRIVSRSVFCSKRVKKAFWLFSRWKLFWSLLVRWSWIQSYKRNFVFKVVLNSLTVRYFNLNLVTVLLQTTLKLHNLDKFKSCCSMLFQQTHVETE